RTAGGGAKSGEREQGWGERETTSRTPTARQRGRRAGRCRIFANAGEKSGTTPRGGLQYPQSPYLPLHDYALRSSPVPRGPLGPVLRLLDLPGAVQRNPELRAPLQHG